MKNLNQLIADESGAGVVEYAALAGIGTLAVLAFGNLIDTSLANVGDEIGQQMQGVADGAAGQGAPTFTSGGGGTGGGT